MIGFLKLHKIPFHLPKVHIISNTILPQVSHYWRVGPAIVKIKHPRSTLIGWRSAIAWKFSSWRIKKRSKVKFSCDVQSRKEKSETTKSCKKFKTWHKQGDDKWLQFKRNKLERSFLKFISIEINLEFWLWICLPLRLSLVDHQTLPNVRHHCGVGPKAFSDEKSWEKKLNAGFPTIQLTAAGAEMCKHSPRVLGVEADLEVESKRQW